MAEGFIMLRRTPETFELLRDRNAFVLLTVIALRAQRTNGFNIRGLQPGQALLGDHECYGLSLQQYRSAKRRLQRWRFADFQSTNRGTLATLLDTRIYDIHKDREQQACNRPATDRAQATDQRPTTTNKDEKKRTEKKHPDNSDELRLAQFLLDSIRQRKADMRSPDLQAWAVEIGRMIRLDHREPQRIEAVIRWCRKDPFWWKNILSARKLREHFDRLEIEMGGQSARESTRDRITRLEQEAPL